MGKTIDGVVYSWDQPICDEDWDRLNPDRVPYRLKDEHRETALCAWCGQETRSGIFKRTDPAEVPFPAREDDE